MCEEARGVAQPGSALEWGSSGRAFESLRPDHCHPLRNTRLYAARVWTSLFLVDTLMFYPPLAWEKVQSCRSKTSCHPPSKWMAQLLGAVQAALPIMADLSRSDLLLYQMLDGERALVSAHARPHSVSSAHAHDQSGQIVARQDAPLVWRVLARQGGGVVLGEEPGHSMRREVWPVRDSNRRVVAALAVETIAVEVERHSRRSSTFRAALRDLQRMLVSGEILGAENLTPFGEHDGILFVDSAGQSALRQRHR